MAERPPHCLQCFHKRQPRYTDNSQGHWVIKTIKLTSSKLNLRIRKTPPTQFYIYLSAQSQESLRSPATATVEEPAGYDLIFVRNKEIFLSFPDTVGIVFNISEAGEHQAIVGVVSTGLREPGPALTAGLVLDIKASSLIST